MTWLSSFCQWLFVAAICVDVVCGVILKPKDTLCTKATRGHMKPFKNRMGDDEILICKRSKGDGVYLWKYLDGSPSLGEEFDPAKDCSDIVDNVPDAKDDFYWIALEKGKVKKVWCDVHTDGGGFMLIGMKDSPVSWTVPSNSTIVDPKGPPHWSSAFGNFKVQDFAIQVSMNSSFEGTRAHWMYRLSPTRHLGNLFGVGNGGCTDVHSGIGSVAFVKDLQTDTVVTTTFNCSKFGPHVDKTLGWGRMNYCLKHSCPTGYAVLRFPGVRLKLDSFGCFSYSAVSPLSGITHDATAFIGCDDNECCACFGPKGGRNNYCGPKCTEINGGTVIKNAFAWFWVRTSMPKRLWKRCMEFKLKTSKGKFETYFIDQTTGSTHKGSCSSEFQTRLNEGTLSVSDKNSLRNIPPVPGLISYRKDNQQLYVNNGSQWEALNSEKEVDKLEKKVKILEERLAVLSADEVLPSCTAMKGKYPYLNSGFYTINPNGNGSSPFIVFCDMISKNGIGVTIIGHDSERRTRVDDHDALGSSKIKILYKTSLKGIAALTKVSRYCEQFIKFECYNSYMIIGSSWWVSRQGVKMNYWGGAAVNSGKCACGMTNSCASSSYKCNCQANDAVLREDSGFLADKTTLPVTGMKFQDTGGRSEYGYFTLGKLLCWG